jgi:hypothetical protein
MAGPIPFRPRVLTIRALENAENWETALALPLPRNPDFDVLKRTRDDVLNYLDWLMIDLEQGKRSLPDVQREIMRAAGRLAEIAGYWQEAYARHIDESLAAEGAESGWGWLGP